ncbi:MAG TPA: chemotaxis protein CheW [Longimicrobiales bacterium]|nr:chemotaxis protein CheW [Longimicrobiales bacterium]
MSNIVAAEAGTHAPAAPQWVVFVCSGRRFGFPLEHVREILTPAPFTRLPGAGPAVCGLIGLRGRLLTVLDAGVILGAAPAADTPDHRVLVLESGGRRVGAAVDGIVAVTRAPLDAPGGEAADRSDAGDRGIAVLGTVVLDSGPFLALDPVTLTDGLLQ